MSKILRCVIAGYGYMGEIRRKVIENHSQLDLVGICDPDPKKREKISGCDTFASIDEMLLAKSEVVFVCTPNRFAPELCIKSMELGKHVFCEKPPGRDIEDIKRIIEAEKVETKLMFGFNHRFHPGVIKAKIIIDSGRLGKVLALRGIYGKSGGKNFSNSWRNNKSISGGGILLDQGIHMLDLILYFCGDFSEVKCFASNSFWKFDCEDNAAVIMQNDRGQTAMLHSSSTLWKHIFRLNIILEDGYIIVEGLLSKTGSYGREKIVVGKRQFEDEAEALGNPSEEVTYFDRDLSWKIEIDEFVKCIQQNSKVSISNSGDAFKVMEIIDKCYRDANTELLEMR